MAGFIRESPDVAKAYLESSLDEASRRLVEALGTGASVVTTGCGTSYHMALAAARYLEAHAGLEARAVPSFDLAWYSPQAARGKIVLAVSHSGATKATLEAVRRVRPFASLVAALSSGPDTKLAKASDLALTLPGGWEEAVPKTMTFTTGAIQLLRIAGEVGRLRFPRAAFPLPGPEETRSAMTRALDANRDTVDSAARAWKDYRVFTFLGGGPAWVTAMEAALKMRENNYTVSEGYEVEEFAHGRTASLEAGRPVVGVVLRGASRGRMNDILAAAGHYGAPTLAVVEEGAGTEGDAVSGCDFRLDLPPMPSEAAAAILAVLPLQWFSHQFSVHNDVNPDTIRLDDPVYAFADRTWVFPPGTH